MCWKLSDYLDVLKVLVGRALYRYNAHNVA